MSLSGSKGKQTKKAGGARPKPRSGARDVQQREPKLARPARASSSASGSQSGSGSDDEGESGDDRAAMLAALQAHGRAMFGLGLDAPEAESSAQAQRRAAASSSGGSEPEEGDDGDTDGDEGAEYHTDDGWGAEDGFVSDSEDEEVYGVAEEVERVAKVPEVVFAPTGVSTAALMSKAERRAFMYGNSAKIMGLEREVDNTLVNGRKRGRNASEEVEDQSNLQLDKTLHDMLLTTLLPSAAADSASRPVEKRNAISGRLMELANYSIPGEGSSSVADAKHSKHSAKIRAGILQKKAKREEKAREEAEAAGSWVRGIGGLGDAGKKKAGAGSAASAGRGRRAGLGEETGKKKGMDGRKGTEVRDRGLSIGIGKFKGGMLTLSEREIARGSGEQRGGRGGGRGGRGGKKRGGGRR